MGNAEDPESNEPDIPEDLDEAMKWLEELAAEQGADLTELPSLQMEEEPAAEAGAVEADDVPDWLKADLSSGELSTEDDLPDWLKNEGASLEDADWLNLAGEDEISDLDVTSLELDTTDSEEDVALPSNDIPDWLKARMPEDLDAAASDSLGDDDEELGWLEQIAAGEGAPLEELPTLSWDNDQDEPGLEIESGDLSWLSEMAEMDDDLSLPEEPELPDMTDLADMSAPQQIESSDDMPGQVPDDPDDAMAWLEQLAAQQGAPLDELPTVIDDVPTVAEMDAPMGEAAFEVDPEAETVFDLPEEAESDFVSEFEVPDDPDEAMAWLEALAAQQGAPLDELPTVVDRDVDIDFEAVDLAEMEETSEAEISEMPTMINLPEEVETEGEEAAGLEIPDDPDEAMAWLEQLAAKQGAPLDELPTVDVMPEMVTPVAGIEMVDLESETAVEMEADLEPEADAEFEMALAELADVDMPEDDDEALAWLEAFAGGGTVAIEEETALDVVDEAEDFSEQPVFEETRSVQEIDLFETDDSPTQIEAVEETPVEIEDEPEEVSLFDAIEDETDQFIDFEDDSLADIDTDLETEDLADALPEWLQFGPIGETSQTDLDWLDSFDDSGAESWMQAEEEISQVGLPVPTPAVEPEPIAFEQLEPVQELEIMDVIEDEETAAPSLAQTGPLDKSQLESARTALEIGDYDSALDDYKSLLDSEQNLPLLIAELETETSKHSNIAGLQRLLGDAYMQNGQLQKAIDTYRQALDNL